MRSLVHVAQGGFGRFHSSAPPAVQRQQGMWFLLEGVLLQGVVQALALQTRRLLLLP